MAKNVITIPATKSRYTAAPLSSKKKRRVAAYARVSTDHEDQQSSYEAQVDYYTRYIIWRCILRLESGKKVCKSSPTILEPVLHDAILRGMRLLLDNKAELLASIQDALNAALESSAENDAPNIHSKIEEKNADMLKLVQFAVDSGAAEDHFDAKFAELAAEIAALRAQAEKLEQSDVTRDTLQTRFDEMMARLENEEPDLDAYNDELVRYYVESITVTSKTQINIRFKMGIEIAEELRYEE